MNLDRAIAETFALLEAVVPNFPEPARKAKAMQVWKMVLERENVTPSELKTALVEFLRTGKFMPTPSEILELVQQVNPCSAILDPVKTGEHMGVPEIGSRERCEALGLPFSALREEPAALPSPESRDEAKSRLERAVERFHVKHLRPERAGLDESPDPEALERRGAMVRAVMEGA